MHRLQGSLLAMAMALSAPRLATSFAAPGLLRSLSPRPGPSARFPAPARVATLGNLGGISKGSVRVWDSCACPRPPPPALCTSTAMPSRFQARSMHVRPALRMSLDPDAKLKELGIELPEVAAAAANYVCARPPRSLLVAPAACSMLAPLPQPFAWYAPWTSRADSRSMAPNAQVPYIVSGNYVYVAGQIPVLNGEIQFKGTVPKDKTMDIAYQSARLCGLNIIAQVSCQTLGEKRA